MAVVTEADPKNWPGFSGAIKDMRKPGRGDSWAWGRMQDILTTFVEDFDPFPEGLVEGILHQAFTARRNTYLGRRSVETGDTELAEILTRPVKLRDRGFITVGMDEIALVLPVDGAASHFRGLLTPTIPTDEELRFYHSYRAAEPSELHLAMVAEVERDREANRIKNERFKQEWLAARVEEEQNRLAVLAERRLEATMVFTSINV